MQILDNICFIDNRIALVILFPPRCGTDVIMGPVLPLTFRKKIKNVQVKERKRKIISKRKERKLKNAALCSKTTPAMGFPAGHDILDRRPSGLL